MDKLYTSGNSSEKNTGSELKITRFTIAHRLAHILLLVSFGILAITGLPQKFPTSPLSVAILNLFGGIESARSVHHISAIVLGVTSIYHALYLLYRMYVMRISLSMMPVITDFRHFYQDILFFLGLRKNRAYYARFNYAEKVEYFAVVWGTILMGITGFMMWNPIATARFLPGQFIPAAKAAHGAEAILAVLSILVWHFYFVHLRYFNKSIFTGKLTRQEMQHEHPAELAEIESDRAWQRPSHDSIRRRRLAFLPVALVLTVVSVYLLYQFVTFETTAITTIPQGETVQVFVPLTPTPRPTPLPTATQELKEGISPESWAGKYEAVFRNRCGSCHGITSVGGLSLASYQDALVGGDNGPAIIPGDPDASVLVQVQAIGDHPGQLTIDELNAVIEWIMAGAPEQ